MSDWFIDLWTAPEEIKQEYNQYCDERLYEENKEDID